MKRFLPVIISVLAVVFGIVFVVSGIHTIATKDLYDSTVTATIVDVQEHWEGTDTEDSHLETTYYIDYEINGVQYKHVESPNQSGNLGIGDTVEILYQSQNPEKIAAPNMTTGAVIFIIVGAVVAIGGCISTVRAIFKIR